MMAARVHPIDVSPRRFVWFEDGRRFESTVTPEPFDAARAREIAAHGVSSYDNAMTRGETAFVDAVWAAIPDGSSCWMTAFWKILRGQVYKIKIGGSDVYHVSLGR